MSDVVGLATNFERQEKTIVGSQKPNSHLGKGSVGSSFPNYSSKFQHIEGQHGKSQASNRLSEKDMEDHRKQGLCFNCHKSGH